jgi:pimeloyl-ACP methyl ester carboxylesterase
MVATAGCVTRQTAKGPAKDRGQTDDGVLLHSVTEGHDAPVTVVLAHGFAARLEEYEPQRRALRDRTRLVLFDQRGHGRSGWGSQRSATIDRLGRDLGCVIDELTGDRPVVLVGHSMGGMAVLALARQRADLFTKNKVVGVALLSTSAGHLSQSRLPTTVARVALRSGFARHALWLLWMIAPVIDRLGFFGTAS